MYLADVLQHSDNRLKVTNVKYRESQFDVAKVPTALLQ